MPVFSVVTDRLVCRSANRGWCQSGLRLFRKLLGNDQPVEHGAAVSYFEIHVPRKDPSRKLCRTFELSRLVSAPNYFERGDDRDRQVTVFNEVGLHPANSIQVPAPQQVGEDVGIENRLVHRKRAKRLSLSIVARRTGTEHCAPARQRLCWAHSKHEGHEINARAPRLHLTSLSLMRDPRQRAARDARWSRSR